MNYAEQTTSIAFLSPRGLKLSLLSWFAMLGFDFFLHGGMLAGLYTTPSSFLLTPQEAFQRIPIGYLGFLISAGFLTWLAMRVGIRKWPAGVVLGGAVGGVTWLSLALGMYSISTARPGLLLAWALGQTVESAYAGGLIGYALERQSLRRPFWIVLVATVALVALSVILQSTG